MDRLISLCLVIFVCVQLPGSGEAYFVNGRRNDNTGSDVGTLNDKDNKLEEATWNRREHHDRKQLHQEKKAKEDVDEEIEELLKTFKAAERFNLKGIDGDLDRVNKRAGWWWCPWCDGSKLIILYIGKLFDCKCELNESITCKCPNGKVLKEDMFKGEQTHEGRKRLN